MRKRSVKKYSVPVCLLVTSLTAAPVFADWYTNQTGAEGYYKPNEYHNDKFGNFPPADIDEKLFSHLNTTKKEAGETPVESKAQTIDVAATTNSKQTVVANNPQARYPAQQYSQQNRQQPAYNSNNRGSYNQNRNYPQQRNQRNNRSGGFNGPWNNNNSGFSSPWNNRGGNQGMNFSGPWDNNGSSFGGPWNSGGNNRGSGFSGPWDNNGSSFSMPFGNNRGNNGSGFNPMGSGSSWGW